MSLVNNCDAIVRCGAITALTRSKITTRECVSLVAERLADDFSPARTCALAYVSRFGFGDARDGDLLIARNLTDEDASDDEEVVSLAIRALVELRLISGRIASDGLMEKLGEVVVARNACDDFTWSDRRNAILVARSFATLCIQHCALNTAIKQAERDDEAIRVAAKSFLDAISAPSAAREAARAEGLLLVRAEDGGYRGSKPRTTMAMTRSHSALLVRHCQVALLRRSSKA